jgi:hypothetical protein
MRKPKPTNTNPFPVTGINFPLLQLAEEKTKQQK